MNCIEGISHDFRVSVSVAALLQFNSGENKNLLLVRNGSQWGLPAGSLEPNENLAQAIKRELFEESNLSLENIYFDNTRSKNLTLITTNIPPCLVIFLPGMEKSRLGFVYKAIYKGSNIFRPNGWEIRNDTKVNYAKPFNLPDILELMSGHLQGENILYKPEFNEPALIWWLLGGNTAINERLPKCVSGWVGENISRIDYLKRVIGLRGNEFYWHYDNPHLSCF